MSIDTDAFFLAAFRWQLNYDACAHFKIDHEIVQFPDTQQSVPAQKFRNLFCMRFLICRTPDLMRRAAMYY